MGGKNRVKGHNSHTGHAAFIILSGNKGVKVNYCFKNHNNVSSKAMELASAMELFNNAPKQTVKFSFYTGDYN